MSPAPHTSRRISFLAFYLIWSDLKGWEVPALHAQVCEWLERFFWSGARAAVLKIFRGAGKSTIVGVFQAWVLYTDGTFRLLDQAADDRVASKLSKDTRNVLRRHPLCKGMLPDHEQSATSLNVVTNEDARNPSVSAHGVMSNVTSGRAEAAIFDDVEVPKNCRTDQAREDLRERMLEATHVLVPGGWKLFVGTPHAHDSIYDEQTASGAVTLAIPLFRHHVRYEETVTALQKHFPVNFPPEAFADLYVFLGKPKAGRLLIEGTDYRVDRSAVIFERAPGELVDIYSGNAWPERFTRADIVHRRKESRRLNNWDSQYQLHARPIHETRLDPDRVIPYDVEPQITMANGEPRMMLGETMIVGARVYWDCALGKVKGDDSALAVIFTNDRGALFWHVCEALTGDIDAQCLKVREIVVRYGLRSVTVETNGVGGFVPAHLRKALRGTDCAVLDYPVPSSRSKAERILDALEAPLSGRYLWAHVSALDRFESQMRAYVPGAPGQRDDLIDSGAGAIAQTPVRIGRHIGRVDSTNPLDWRPGAGDYAIQIEGRI